MKKKPPAPKRGNFGSIGLNRTSPPKEATAGPPYLSRETSVCRRKAFINAEDAKGAKACWTCGNYHQPEGKLP